MSLLERTNHNCRVGALMELLILIWSFLRGLIPGGRRPAGVRVLRRLPIELAIGQQASEALHCRTFVGWMQHAPEHPLCARPPSAARGSGGPAGPPGFDACW